MMLSLPAETVAARKEAWPYGDLIRLKVQPAEAKALQKKPTQLALRL